MNYYRIRDVKLKIHGRIDNALDVVPLLANGQGIEVNVTGS